MTEVTGDRLRELRRAEERLDLVADHVNEVVLVAAADLSTVEYVTPSYEAVYGRPVETLYDRPWSMLEAVHPDDRDAYRADLEALIADAERGDAAEVYEGEYRLRPGGTAEASDDCGGTGAAEEDAADVRWIAVERRPVRNDDGDVDRFVSVARDVTERKRRAGDAPADDARRERPAGDASADDDPEEGEKYARLVEQSHDGVVIVQDGVYEFANDRFCELTGRDRSDLLGRPVEAVMAPEYRDLVRERYERRVAGDRPPRNYEVELLTDDGDRVEVELTVSRITHDGAPATMANFRDVTERRRREAEIRRLKREYEAVFENARDALFLLDVERPDDGDGAAAGGDGDAADAEFVFRRLNPAHEEKTGLSTADVRGATPREVLGEELGAEVASNYRRCLERGETITYEEELDLPAGTRVWRTKLSPVRVDGEVRQIVGIGRDVTERKRLEERLQTRERRFRLIAEHIDEIMYLARADYSEILYINPAYEEIYGRSVESLYDDPRSFVDAAHPEDRERYERDVERMVEAVEADDEEPEDTYEGEYRLRRDGETRWVRVTRYPVENEDGTIDRVVGIVQDITERRELERTYRDIFENVSDGLVVHDPEEHRILDVNQRYCELTGHDRDDLVGAGLERVAGPGAEYTRERAERLIERAREEGPQLFEWMGQRADGTTYASEVSLSVVEIEGRERVLASVRDVTERKRRERIVRRLHESTDRIQEAETVAGVCEATVAAAREVLDLPLAACWLTDGSPEPVAATERTRELAAGPAAFGPARVADAGPDDGAAVYEPETDGTPIDRALVVPLGARGALTGADPSAAGYDDVVLDAARILARHATAALDRAERERERRASERRLRAILDRIDEAVFLARADELADPSPAPDYLSSGYEAIWGRSLAEIESEHEEGFFGTIHPDDADGYRALVERIVAEIDAGEADDRYVTEYRIERPDGTVRHVRSEFYPLDRDDAPTQVVAVSRDVTDRKERERTLETFHEATRELTEAGSRHEASQRAIDAAEAVLGFPLVSVHLYDEDEGSLRPVAETARLEEALDFLPSFGPEDGVLWESFVDREAVRRSEDGMGASGIYGGGVPDPELVLPLGSHGVMLVGAPDRAFDAEAVELAQILAATLEAALNHVEGRRELERREAELAEHRERAERLERLNTVIREIEAATVEATSRDGVESALCEHLTTVESYRAAWVAEPAAGDDGLVTRAGAGEDPPPDAVAVESGGAGVDRHPAARALDEGAVRAVRNLATSTAQGDWRAAALRAGYQALAAVPLVHDGTTYGVVTIAAADPTAFDERTREVLGELGRSVGYTVAVLERQEALESDTTVELEFAVADEGLRFVRLAERTGAAVSLERTVRRSGGSLGAFYAVEGADPDAVVDAVRTESGVEEVTLVSEDGTTCLVEVVTGSWFGTLFAEHGAVVRTATADGEGEGRLVVEAPQAADVRALVERFRDRHSDVDLVAQRTRERAVQSLLELQDLLDDRLTSRQLEALETAYSAGYFEWPRASSGEEVADLLGVTQPTFNKHLRTAERKTFSMLLDREYPAESSAG